MIQLNNNELHHIGQHFTPDIKGAAFRLAHINRYNGAVGTYSVAQHCCLVASVLPEALRLDGLLHDLPEAWIGDIVNPLKVRLPEYKQLEHHYHAVVDEHFGVLTRHPDVKAADLRMLVTEAKAFGLDLTHFPDVKPLGIEIRRWTPAEAESTFIKLFEVFTACRAI